MAKLFTHYQLNWNIPEFTKTLIQRYKMQIAMFGKLAFGENLMIKVVRDWMKKKKKNLSNVDLSTYCDGTDTQKEEWDEAYMQAVLSCIIIMNCSDSSICEKLDESIMNGQGQYPETISQAVALLTATSRANKAKKK